MKTTPFIGLITNIPFMAVVMTLLFQPIFPHLLSGQTKNYKNALAIRFMGNDYQYPILRRFDQSRFGAAAEVTYSRAFSDGFHIAFPIKFGQAHFPQNETATELETRKFASADLILRLQMYKEKSFVIPSIHAGASGVWEAVESYNFQFPLGFGLDFKLGPKMYFSTKAEYRIGLDDLKDNAQAGAGLKFFFGKPEPPPVPEIPPITDSDGDGIADTYDACPLEAGPSKFSGCPDTDGDGIADKDDDCPDEVGAFKFRGCPDTDNDGIPNKDDQCPDEFGLPENGGCPIGDTDGDGTLDNEDPCPTQAGPPVLKGCPDSDGDLVPDKDDQCPETYGAISTKGCPDTDGDGIIDKDDQCPERAGPITNKGCPEIKKEDKEVLIFATQAIQFRTGSAVITTSSYVLLDQIADILKKYPDYKVNIDGYTDSVGSANINQSLSERRAKACFDYLITKGISPNRMAYKGFGEANPLGDNSTAIGRERNRRVEFNLSLKE